jgi:phosphotransferase system IIA component
MKLMNEIEAEVTGTVISKHVESGRAVEYGESLLTIRAELIKCHPHYTHGPVVKPCVRVAVGISVT